jgi:hypothetical protein
MSNPADRGKDAEGYVKSALSTCARTDLAWYRLPDARSGSRAPTLADFLIHAQGRMMLLEVKEVKHDFRLPHKNFDTDKIARMHRYKLSGALTYVLVRFMPSDVWRLAELSFFLQKEGGSWDMREFTPGPLKQFINIGKHASEKLILCESLTTPT